jgi:hypothetical protein
MLRRVALDVGRTSTRMLCRRLSSRHREVLLVIRYLTEDEHVNRMAQAIYLAHNRRITLVAGWDHLNEERRDAFRSLAKDAVAGADRIRAALSAFGTLEG